MQGNANCNKQSANTQPKVKSEYEICGWLNPQRLEQQYHVTVRHVGVLVLYHFFMNRKPLHGPKDATEMEEKKMLSAGFEMKDSRERKGVITFTNYIVQTKMHASIYCGQCDPS